MERCQQCGAAVQADDAVCSECGMPAGLGFSAASLSVPSLTLPRELELIVSTRPLNMPQQLMGARLLVVRGGTEGREFPLAPEESLIGRWDPDCGSHPQVDLSDEDTEAKISRKHARIVCRHGEFVLEDLGSRNGTYLNRVQRLTPHQSYPLRNGDEIIIGKLFLKFMSGTS